MDARLQPASSQAMLRVPLSVVPQKCMTPSTRAPSVHAQASTGAGTEAARPWSLDRGLTFNGHDV